MQQVNRPDPAPSRWAYRFERLMLTPLFRKVLRVGVPLALCVAAGAIYLSDEARRDALALKVAELRHEIETRPEFMVQLLAVDGASTGVEEDIREIFPFDLPVSSFELELEQVREMIVGLPAVADADVRLRQGGVLVAEVTEREPVAVWRTRDGLVVVDAEGVSLADLRHRSDRADLPVIAGEGADKAVTEALRILQAAAPLADDMRGLVRMGERRWDVVMQRGQRIMLPESEPVRALERVIVLNEVQDMLARDLVAVDMRLAARPTIRMNEAATEEWWRITKISSGAE